MLLVTHGFMYRIYPNKEQKVLINKTLGCARFVYNHFLHIRMDEWKFNHKAIYYKDTSKLLTDLKKYPEYEWLKEVDSVALQQSLKDLQTAYDNFFKGRTRYPRFKSKHEHRQSYRTVTCRNNIRIIENRIQLPKIGKVKTKLSREVSGQIRNATIIRTASNNYFVSLCVEYETDLQPSAGGQVGIDVGIKSFYSDSNGNVVENPKFLAKYMKKLICEQRKLSRKKLGSGQWKKQRVRVARVHEKITNTRNDFQHKLSYRLANENSLVAVEKLNIKGMMRNKKLAKAISDAAWSKFFEKLEYKTKEHGGKLVKIPTFYPSSQTCHVCGFQNPIVKNLSVRDWICPQCGTYHDRDQNAAINILKKGAFDENESRLNHIKSVPWVTRELAPQRGERLWRVRKTGLTKVRTRCSMNQESATSLSGGVFNLFLQKEDLFMRINYYNFPEEMSIRDVALITKREIEGKTEITEVPDDVTDEDLERNFSYSVDVSVTLAKKLMKKYGGTACTCHFDRDGGLFETTPILLKGNNSRHKYNRHL